MKTRLALGVALFLALAAVPVPGYWLFTLNAGVILAVSVLGLMVVVGWAREVSLAQAGLTGTGVYVYSYAARSGHGLHLPFLAAALVTVVVVVGLSALVSLATARLSGIYIIVLTLALQEVIERTVFVYPWLGGVNTDTVPRPSPFGISLASDRAFYVFSLLVLGALLVILARLRASRFGGALLLVGIDRQVAASVGVSPWKAKVFAFVVAGVCAGVAGTLTAALYTTPPIFIGYTAFNSLLYLSIPVLAGFRSLLGVALVGLAFPVAPQALQSLRVSPFHLAAAALLVGTLVGPGGLSGLLLDRLDRRRRPWRPGAVTGWQTLASGGADVDLDADPGYRKALAVLHDYLPPAPPPGDALEVDGISVSFGAVRALHYARVTIGAGQFVGLIGPNGAGKTTLFDVINGLRSPDEGTIRLFGADVTATRPWERAELGLSRTFQASRLNLDLSVRENLLSGAYSMIPGRLVGSILGFPRATAGTRRAHEAARAVATLLQIDHYWDEPVRMLSFGNRRRVEIGRSLMSGPRLLLLDEPSAGLDPAGARLLFATVKRLHHELGLTVLLVEHNVRAVLQHCDVIHVLSRGRVVAVGAPDDVVDHPDVRSQYLGDDFFAELKRSATCTPPE